jgi:hypothetical protein
VRIRVTLTGLVLQCLLRRAWNKSSLMGQFRTVVNAGITMIHKIMRSHEGIQKEGESSHPLRLKIQMNELTVWSHIADHLESPL